MKVKERGEPVSLLAGLNPGFRKILGNTGWLMADRVLRMGVGLVVGVWVARYLGPGRFGTLNFALSFVALFAPLTTLGLDGIVVRDIVRIPQQALRLLGSTMALRTIGCAISIVSCLASARWIEPHDREALILASIVAGGMIFQIFDTIDLYFQSQVQSKLTVIAKNTAFLLAAALRVELIYVHARVWAFAAAGVAELALGALGLVIAYCWTTGSMWAWSTSRITATELLVQGWPAALSGMAIMLYMRIDTVMLKVMQGDVAVGVYAAATRISEVWYFIPVAIVSSVAPSIIRKRDEPETYYRRLRMLFSGMVYLALTIGSAVALASHWIVLRLYSNAYVAAGPVLAVHVWASIFVFLGVAQGPWDASEDLLRLSLYRTVAGAVANIALNFYLIPRYAALGAAIATVVSYAISAFLANAFHARTRPIFYLQLRSVIPQFTFGNL